MPEDYLGGLDRRSIVPLDADHTVLRYSAAPDAHPWRDRFRQRITPPSDLAPLPPSTEPPPACYEQEHQLHGPPARVTNYYDDDEIELHNTIRLCDVEAFRKVTASKARAHANGAGINDIVGGISRLLLSSKNRPVIYRYIDCIRSDWTLLEAIHFELFMPDRPDLRFLAVPYASLPNGPIEGDLFRISDADPLAEPPFAVKLDTATFPVLWEAKGVEKVAFADYEGGQENLAYIVKKKARAGGERAISDISDKDFFVRETLFPDGDHRREHSLVHVRMKPMATAHLYPVEPPLPPPPPPPPASETELIKTLTALTPEERFGLYRKLEPDVKRGREQDREVLDPDQILQYLTSRVRQQLYIPDIYQQLLKALCDLKWKKANQAKKEEKGNKGKKNGKTNGKEKEKQANGNGIVPFAAAFGNTKEVNGDAAAGEVKVPEKTGELQTPEKEEEPPFDPRSEYLKGVYGTRTSFQWAGKIVSKVRALDAAEEERIEDRLGKFMTYGEPGDLELIDRLFRLGSCFRSFAAQGADASEVGEMRIDESIVLQTIRDRQIGDLSECRALLNCIYDRRYEAYGAYKEEHFAPVRLPGSEMQLNEAQSMAVRLYADETGPRVFCILSPPGSGKTTVAAAMAAEVGRNAKELRRKKYTYGYKARNNNETIPYYGSVQLLLSVQNVAVDNMGAALQKMDYGGGTVYNMKSTKKLNFNDPAPYDFFDLMTGEELAGWKSGKVIQETVLKEKAEEKEKEKRNQYNRKPRREKKDEEYITQHRRDYEKTVNPKILLSTVEMVLQKMYTDSKLVSDLKNVRRIIIDEASLLTEAALYCIIRRFPEARIVLIGDDKQLPPFMYDSTVLGHELAGRPALNVAMKTGKIPVVELNEVYRAPPTLVAPYNRLAYGGRLVSQKDEGEYPLSEIGGLIHWGLPQLLLIDVDGREERNEATMSMSNKKELDVLVRLLAKFPPWWTQDIMIICLYKDQKRKLQEILDKQYALNPVPEKQYSILTVDSAQGKEKPIVILMTTRTQKASDFFRSVERCNVAVSRQQKALIILGKASLLTTNDPWSKVVNGDDFTQVNGEDIK